MGAPSEVTARQLRELSIRLDLLKKWVARPRLTPKPERLAKSLRMAYLNKQHQELGNARRQPASRARWRSPQEKRGRMWPNRQPNGLSHILGLVRIMRRPV